MFLELFESVLLEAVDYSALIDNKTKDIDRKYNINYLRGVDNYIENTVSKYKKNDVVMWVLKFYRYTMYILIMIELHKIFSNTRNVDDKKKVESDLMYVVGRLKKFDKKNDFGLGYTNRLYDLSPDGSFVGVGNLGVGKPTVIGKYKYVNRLLDKYLKLVDTVKGKGINLPTFGNNTISKIEYEIKNAISEYTESKQYRTERLKNSIFLKINDKLAWYDLKTNDCPIEAREMGHCGRASDPSSTLLSLRELKSGVLKPVVTVEYNHKKKTIHQIRGFGNSGPSEKYINAVFMLLKDPRIVKIGSGVYATNIDDLGLSDKQIKWLRHNKPGLFDPDYDGRSEGIVMDGNYYMLGHVVTLDKFIDGINIEFDGAKELKTLYNTAPKSDAELDYISDRVEQLIYNIFDQLNDTDSIKVAVYDADHIGIYFKNL